MIDMKEELLNILEEFRKYKLGSDNNRESSVKNYLIYLNEFFRKMDKLPGEITIDDIQDYIIYLKVDKKNGVNTQKIKQSSIRLFYDWYSRRYRIENPAYSLRPIQEEIKVAIMPTPDELTRMVYACDTTTFTGRRDAAVICLFADTGIRLGECSALNIENIQVHKNNYICIVPRKPGVKARRERMIEFGELTQGALIGETFSAYYTDIKYVQNYKYGDPLFKQQGIIHKDGRLGPQGLRFIIHKYQVKSEIDRSITPKSFRHFFGTYSVINDTPIQHLKELMGHAWLETTMRYVHWAEVIKADSLKKRGTSGLKAPESGAGFTKIIKDAHSRS